LKVFLRISNKFIALQKYGKRWGLVKNDIPNRTSSQIRTHAQKFFIKLSYILPPNTDPIQFLRARPAAYFMDLPNHPPVQKRLRPPSSQDFFDPVSRKIFVPTPMFLENQRNNLLMNQEQRLSIPVNMTGFDFTQTHEAVNNALTKMSNEIQNISQNFREDVKKREARIMVEPLLNRSWRFTQSCFDKIQKIIINIAMYQQEAIYGGWGYAAQNFQGIRPSFITPSSSYNKQ